MRTKNFQMFKLDLEKAEESEIKLPTPAESQKKQENSIKTFTFALLTILNSLTVWIAKKLWKILNETGIANHLTCLLWNLYTGQEATVRTRHGTTEWFQIGKGVYRQGCILPPSLFNLYAETSCEMLGWMKHKLESRLPGEISITSDMQMTSLLWQKVKN